QNLVRYRDQERKLPLELAERLAPILGTTREDLVFGETGSPVGEQRVRSAPRKFIRNKSFKFYVKDWRAFMGVKVEDAAETAGMPAD
ncbi:hypothetical protein, partial [Stenotrophomonas maltophilia]|uniref:hypothetical protein n=1 Tax=Stenotrophomonas maltophilia TaxID=40324 RepID=UPI0013DB7226